MDLLAPIKWLGDMFYPNICAVCQSGLAHGELDICIHCLSNLPKTHFGFQKHNPVEKLFWGRIPLEFAGAFLYFYHQGITQDILHQIKYRGAKDLALLMGIMYGEELKKSTDFSADMLIPVPLHPRKQRQRGYNQSEAFAKGLGQVLDIKVRTDLVTRNSYTTSQTRKTRYNRWENVDGIFKTNKPADIANKKVILVDDVITTGSTLEALASSILGAKPSNLGLLSLAVAKN